MFRSGTMVLLSGLLLALAAEAQPGPGLFGDRRWRGPVEDAAALPASGTTGEVRLTLDDGALHFWDGDSWEDVAGSGSGGGEANTASNVGGGLGLFSAKVGVDLRFNSLAAADFDLSGNVVSIDDTKWAKDSEIPSGDIPHSRTVTVDAGGLGDYASIGAAVAFVATQTRSDSTQWLILVYPGTANPASGYDDWWNYLEDPLTVPTFTTVQGVSAGHNTPVVSSGAPIVRLSHESGPGIVLSHGSALVNLEIIYYAEPSAPARIVSLDSAGGTAVIQNIAVKVVSLSADQPVTGIEVEDGALYLYDASVGNYGFSNAGSSAVVVAGIGASIYGGRFYGSSPCTALVKATGSLLKLFWVRLDAGDCTYDIVNDGGDVRAVSTPYSSSLGTVTHDDGSQGFQFCKTYSGTGSPEGALSAPVCSSYWRRDGGAGTALYLKESGSGSAGWVAVDDVPEVGDFGALALTGPVTSSGLATTIAADAVALGSQTTGNYVSGATASQGLALTGTEGASLGLMDCAAGEIPKRNAGDTGWECAADAGAGGGAGDVVGPSSATDNALVRFDSTTGKLVQNSTATLDDSGALVLPDGSATATGIRFASYAAGTGLFGNGSTTLTFAFGGVSRFSISNATITTQNGSNYRNAGAGEAVFAPGNGDTDSGLGASASDDMAMYAAGFPIERWLRVTAGVYRSLTLGQAVDSPQAVTCTSDGTGAPGALTVSPTGSAVYVTNSDPDGCALTLGETNVTSGQRVEFVVASSAGGTVNYSDTAGVSELAGAFSAGLYDSLALRYVSDRWVETGRSDN